MDSSRFRLAIEMFDRANRDDPRTIAIDGRQEPEELMYAQRMTARLEKLQPDASEVLRLAARCQHIRRWIIPRNQFPMDRIGYLKWRTTLYQFHAEQAGQILREAGYDDATIARVGSLLRKQRIKNDPEMQALEDVACLVFLEHYFSTFARAHDEAKVIGILQKTWKKMSQRGRVAAMNLVLPQSDRKLFEKALR